MVETGGTGGSKVAVRVFMFDVGRESFSYLGLKRRHLSLVQVCNTRCDCFDDAALRSIDQARSECICGFSCSMKVEWAGMVGERLSAPST